MTTAGPLPRSRKRSGVSASPNPLTFFVDRSLGRIKVVEALRAANQAVVLHEDVFPQNAKDRAWLAEAGRNAWVVLSKDKHIQTRPNELAALLEAGVAAFVLTSGNVTGQQMAAAYVAALPKMIRMLESHERPFVARITTAGDVALVAIPKT